MEFDYSFLGESTVNNTSNATNMSFSPDLNRDPTYFSGLLSKPLEFREAISALHDVVVSDMRLETKDREEYKLWLETRENEDLEEVMAHQQKMKELVNVKRLELQELEKDYYKKMQPFWNAQNKYFCRLFVTDYKAWWILDPVITVHPDSVFFECFSKDESTFGTLSVNYNVMQSTGDLACGTTNIDYSSGLYNEFQKIRTYKETKFEIAADGFSVEVEREEAFQEVKIDLPDSWMRGFLQVSSAMNMPQITFDLSPVDMHNICFKLRRKKEILGPRSLRFQLTPGKPVQIVFEPWNDVLVCKRSIYKGPREEEVRLWGRRRLHILERLIPVSKKFTVKLLGSGMPSFFIADMGDLSFTLGLSGWSANDWSKAGNFDLMAPRADVDDLTKTRVFDTLKKHWFRTVDELADELKLDRTTVLGALSLWTQAGKVIYDMKNEVYRCRELTKESLPLHLLRFTNEREESAERFIQEGAVNLGQCSDNSFGKTLRGIVRDKNKKYEVELIIDKDEALKQAICQCNYYQQNKLYKGPCEHMLAIRKKVNEKVNEKFKF
jgi:hypothetical protein